MNPTSLDPTAPPPPPLLPPRSSFSCDRHPTEQFTGFCPSCLCERLHTLDQSSNNTPSSSRRPSSASAAIKSLFTSASKPSNFPPPPPPAPKPAKTSSFFPELRRTKSFSASKNEALGLFFEPQRKSCDVRARNTLSSLFTLDDDYKGDNPSISAFAPSFQQNHQKIESENDKDLKAPIVAVDAYESSGDEIRSVHEENSSNVVEIVVNNSEIVEEETVNVNCHLKNHIDMDTREKKSSGGGIWSAASVFSKKWHKWRRKQKMKKPNSGENNFATLPVEKPISRQYRETQSEIADYGFGRRSCDTDPRFSLDAGRISFDGPRYSFDEPRASWDGYLIGGRSLSRMAPMVSVVEDAPPPPPPPPPPARSDMQIPVEEDNEGVPGGSTQTREYYSDSFSRRRKSLDRSSSIRKTVVAEIDELKSVSNAKVSPTTADCFQGAKIMVGEGEFSSSSVIGKEVKKSRRWSWRIWGFIQRRNAGNSRDDDDEKYSRVNGVDRSYWQDTNRHMFRSNSSASWRNADHISGGSGKKNRSARYSPNYVNNGLLRLYLAPHGPKPNKGTRSSGLRMY